MFAEKIVKMLANAFRKNFDDFEGIYLFGEFLDGKNHSGEDICLVALFKTQNMMKREKIWPIVGQVETQTNVCIDLYPYTDEEFKEDEELHRIVMKTGIFYDVLGQKKEK